MGNNNTFDFFPDRREVGLVKPNRVNSRILSAERKPGGWWDESKKNSSGKKSDPKIYNCETCGLAGGRRSCKIDRYGKGKKGILIVGLCPGREDAKYGVSFSGKDGSLLRKQLRMLGIDLDEDCVRTYAVRCYKSAEPSADQVKCCYNNLLKDIEEIKPKLILCFGDKAIKAVLPKPSAVKVQGGFTASLMRGLTIPSQRFKCWVGSSFSPQFYVNRQRSSAVPDDQNIMLFDIASSLAYLDRPIPIPFDEQGNYLATTVEEAVAFIQKITNIDKPTAYDYEATSISPFIKNPLAVSIAFSCDVNEAYFIPLNFVNPNNGQQFFSDADKVRIHEAWSKFLTSSTPKVVQNLNMEGSWNREYFKTRQLHLIHDTMEGSHVLRNVKKTNGLAFQVFLMVGHDYKSMVDVKNILASRLEDLFHYNCYDARYTLLAYYWQKPKLKRDSLENFNEFMLRGQEVLLGMQCRGVPIDKQELARIEDQYKKEMNIRIENIQNIHGIRNYLEDNKVDFNAESTPQIAAILKNVYKICPQDNPKLPTTRTGKLSTDKNALPVILELSQNAEVKKFLEGILRFRKCGSLVKRAKNYWKNLGSDGRVHPSFYLLASTYRSSAEEPSIQNVFKHDPELKIFRRVIVPSLGRIILEPDYSGVEVRGIAMNSGDPVLIQEIADGVDPHKYWASLIYEIPEEDVNAEQRYESKNGFVFPSFFGATVESICRRFHMIRKGRIAEVQRILWNRYVGVREWQLRTIEKYKQLGYVEGISGFRRYGPLNINKIYNTPVQGPSFHLTLNSLITLDYDQNSILHQYGFRSEPIFEVHDSIPFDAVPEEAKDLVQVVSRVMTYQAFPWQRNITASVDWEIGVNNWYDLRKLVFRNCNICGKSEAPQGQNVIKLDTGEIEEHYLCGFCRKEERILV